MEGNDQTAARRDQGLEQEILREVVDEVALSATLPANACLYASCTDEAS